jgi:dTDP-4-dehydrorhamnose reductase
LEKLLIIGSSGLVGSKIAALSSKHGFEAYNATHSRKTSLPRALQMDITDHDSTLHLVRQIKPNVIINTSAVTNVDYCETHAEEARRLNVDGVRNLAEAASENKSRLVQISTDYVFDGTFGNYSEDDGPNPINNYGRTKLDAEQIVSRLPSYGIARPSVIYGWNPRETSGTPSKSLKPMNFAMFIIDKLKKNEPVKVVRDQYSSPTFADNLGEALIRIAKHHVNGIFHAAGRSCLSRYEFAVRIASLFEQPIGLIEPVFSSEFKQVAPRPKNTCLRIEKAEHVLGMKLLSADEGISEMRSQMLLW